MHQVAEFIFTIVIIFLIITLIAINLVFFLFHRQFKKEIKNMRENYD